MWSAILTEILDGIDYGDYSVRAVVERVAAYRGRPIRLEPRPARLLKLGGYGLWLAGEKYDYIFYDRDTAPIHQHHTILHELGHMLLGHRTCRVEAGSRAFDLVLMRATRRDSREERDAERLAVRMQQVIIERLKRRALVDEQATTAAWSELVTRNLL